MSSKSAEDLDSLLAWAELEDEFYAKRARNLKILGLLMLELELMAVMEEHAERLLRAKEDLGRVKDAIRRLTSSN